MFFFIPENIIFLVSFFLVVAIGLIELLAMIFGMSLSIHADDFLSSHIDASDSLFAQGLDWLNRGKVPFLILLVLFLSCFSLSGFVIQWLVVSVVKSPFPSAVIAVPALIFTVFLVKRCSLFIAKVIPQHESSAVSEGDFIGCMAIITGGEGRINSPAQCRLVDKYNQTHYLLVQPESADEVFNPGDKVLITTRVSSSVFIAVHNPWPAHL